MQSFKENAYSEYHLFMLRNIATYSAIAIENAEAYQMLHQTLTALKSTQAMLIQAEKMASLGELTAGIAHEIQNLLNFINNFSELNAELIGELKSGLNTGNREEALLMVDNIRNNEHKIIHHGKRADSIVKGMLQHRAGTGTKELTNINALTDESLRLRYHGLWAKAKAFNAKFDIKPEENLPELPIVPQDISRVLPNLFTNAFYAVSEKKKELNGTFDPAVSVSTKKRASNVEIEVKDNGTGIPPNFVSQIFQPIFTTKATTQGTGLGLSINYNIINTHGGNIRVNSQEGEGATFTISLPCFAAGWLFIFGKTDQHHFTSG